MSGHLRKRLWIAGATCAAIAATAGFKLYEHVVYSSAVNALAARLPGELDAYYRAHRQYPNDLQQLAIDYHGLDGASPYCLKWFQYKSWGQAYEIRLGGRELASRDTP